MYSFKVCLFGEEGVGKSTIFRKFEQGLPGDFKITLGIRLRQRNFMIDGNDVSLHFWDLTEEQNPFFRSFTFYQSTYFKGAMGCIYVFDITKQITLEKLESWLDILNKALINDYENSFQLEKDLEEKTNSIKDRESLARLIDSNIIYKKRLERLKEDKPIIPVLLVGNKTDLSSERVVSYKKAFKMQEKFKFFDYIETSAKTGDNIHDLFILIGRKLLEFANL